MQIFLKLKGCVVKIAGFIASENILLTLSVYCYINYEVKFCLYFDSCNAIVSGDRRKKSTFWLRKNSFTLLQKHRNLKSCQQHFKVFLTKRKPNASFQGNVSCVKE